MSILVQVLDLIWLGSSSHMFKLRGTCVQHNLRCEWSQHSAMVRFRLGGCLGSSRRGFVPWELSRDDDSLHHWAHYVEPASSADIRFLCPAYNMKGCLPHKSSLCVYVLQSPVGLVLDLHMTWLVCLHLKVNKISNTFKILFREGMRRVFSTYIWKTFSFWESLKPFNKHSRTTYLEIALQ